MILSNKLYKNTELAYSKIKDYRSDKKYVFSNRNYWYFRKASKIHISFSGILLKELGYEPKYAQWIDQIKKLNPERHKKLIAVAYLERGLPGKALREMGIKYTPKIEGICDRIASKFETGTFDNYIKNAIKLLKEENL